VIFSPKQTHSSFSKAGMPDAQPQKLLKLYGPFLEWPQLFADCS